MKYYACTLAGVFLLGWPLQPVESFSNAPSSKHQCYESSKRSRIPIISVSATTSSSEEKNVAILPLPPTKGQNLYRCIRDTFSYISNPNRFIRLRSEELGPIFLTYQFFKPCVIIGGQETVKEFVTGNELQRGVVYPTMPEAFVELHTEWGTINLDSNDEKFKQARGLFADVLQSKKAMGVFSELIYAEVEAYMEDLVDRVKKDPEQAIFLMPELTSFFLQVFSKVISGKGLTTDQEQMFRDYNTALLSLSKGSNQYKKGYTALTELTAEMLQRYKEAGESEENTGRWYHDQVAGRRGFEDDRISTTMVLFIWAAYVECANLAVNTLAQIAQYPERNLLTSVRREITVAESIDEILSTIQFKYWDQFDYTLGLLRETLRLVPPGPGIPRYGPSDFALAGYRIPSGTPIMMDPRIGNNDPALFPEPGKFEPLRWIPASGDIPLSSQCPLSGTSLERGAGSWFPGGFGAHQCPGIPIAELVGKMLVTKMASEFDSWENSGDGLTKDGEIKYVNLPIMCPVDEFGMKFKLAEDLS